MSWGEGDQQRDMGIKSKSEAEAREIKPEPPRAITLLMKPPKHPLDSLTEISCFVKLRMNQSTFRCMLAVCFNLEMLILMVTVSW